MGILFFTKMLHQNAGIIGMCQHILRRKTRVNQRSFSYPKSAVREIWEVWEQANVRDSFIILQPVSSTFHSKEGSQSARALTEIPAL